MAIIFQDGFETLPFTGLIHCPPWTATFGTPTVVAAPVHHGSYSAYFDNRWDYCRKTIVGQTTVFARAYYYLTQLPAANQFMEIMRFRGGGATIMSARIRYDLGVLQVGFRRYVPGILDVYTNFNWLINTWYCLEMNFVKHAITGHHELWVNEIQRAVNAGVNTSGAADVDTVDIGVTDAHEC